MDSSKCVYCDSENRERINSYKHHWMVCGDCQNVTRELKNTLPLDYLKKFAPLTSKNIAKMLWHEVASQQDNRTFYDYYDSVVSKQSKDTKWEGELACLEELFAKCGLQMQGPALDISGGPGFLVEELNRKGIPAMATEFSDKAVRKMREVLGIECVSYDYNNHSLIEQIGQREFETILIRNSINFCRDLNKFCTELYAISQKDAIVYVDFSLPTLGVCLRWQHDEYTYECLWHPHTLRLYFEMAGFKLIHSFSQGSYHAFSGRMVGFGKNKGILKSLLKTFFMGAFTLPYYLKGKSSKFINRSLQQKGMGFIFQKV